MSWRSLCAFCLVLVFAAQTDGYSRNEKLFNRKADIYSDVLTQRRSANAESSAALWERVARSDPRQRLPEGIDFDPVVESKELNDDLEKSPESEVMGIVPSRMTVAMPTQANMKENILNFKEGLTNKGTEKLPTDFQLDGEVETFQKPEEDVVPPLNSESLDVRRISDEEDIVFHGNSTQGSEATQPSDLLWSDPQLFVDPLPIDPETKIGSIILSTQASSALNSSIEFVCNNPEKAYCFTDLLSPNVYQLRVIYASQEKPSEFVLPVTVISRSTQTRFDDAPHQVRNYTVAFVVAETNKVEESIDGKPVSEESLPAPNDELMEEFRENGKEVSGRVVEPSTPPTAVQSTKRVTIANIFVSSPSKDSDSKLPMLTFAPHFEHSNYDIYVPEGKSEKATVLAILLFYSPAGSAAPSFKILSDVQEWFEIGDVATQQDPGRIISAVTILQRSGVEVDESRGENGFYRFTIQAKQGDFTTTANVNVEIITFSTKRHNATLIETTSQQNPTSTAMMSGEPSASAASTEDTEAETSFPSGEQEPTQETIEQGGNHSHLEGLGSGEETESFLGSSDGSVTATEPDSKNDHASAEQAGTISLKVVETMPHNPVDSVQTAQHTAITSDSFLGTAQTTSAKSESSEADTPDVFDNGNGNVDRSEAVKNENIEEPLAHIESQAKLNAVPVTAETAPPMNSFSEAAVTDGARSTEELDNTESTSAASREDIEGGQSTVMNWPPPVTEESVPKSSQHQEPELLSLMPEHQTESMASSNAPQPKTKVKLEPSNSEEPFDFRDSGEKSETVATAELSHPSRNENAEPTEKPPSSIAASESKEVTETTEKQKEDQENFLPEIASTRVYGTKLFMSLKTPHLERLVVPETLRLNDVVPNLDIALSAVEMDPHDVIVVSVNSTAFEAFPRFMQPGKTVFLIVKDPSQLDYEALPKSFPIEISASMHTRPSIAVSRVLQIVKQDASDNPPILLEKSYDFHITESSISGQKVGQLEVRDVDEIDRGGISFRLIGPGSELFTINGGIISVSCPTALSCLDREQTDSYHLLVVATDRGNHNSAPSSVRIVVDDKNDNGPVLRVSQELIQISDGRIQKPFLIKISDEDQYPYNVNEIVTDGNASAFISMEQIREDKYYARLSSLPSEGHYVLELTARDPSGENSPTSHTVQVVVLNTVTKAHFKRTKYERTVNSEKLHKGNPLLQPEFEGAGLDAIRFVILRDDPGWLMLDQYTGNVFVGDVPSQGVTSGRYDVTVAAVNRTDRRVLTETTFSLTVLSGTGMSKVFQTKSITATISKEAKESHATIEILPKTDRASVAVDAATVSAVNEKLHPAKLDKNAISFANGKAILDMARLRDIRSVQFAVASTKDPEDKAMVFVYLSSDPEKVAAARREQSRPIFIHPWKADLNIIPVKLAEESPVGYVLFSLPAYNPSDGTQVTNVRLSGEMSPFFEIDGHSGDIKVLKTLDYEATVPEKRIFEMEVVAGEEPYETTAKLRVELIDIDDNAPRLVTVDKYDLNNLTLKENSRPGTVLFELLVSDADYLYGRRDMFKYTLSGEGANNFQVKETNNTVAVIVSPASDLDCERFRTMFITLRVEDSGGNTDSIAATVSIVDVNDNSPMFNPREYRAEVVENWPPGTAVAIVTATDADSGPNGQILYSLAQSSTQYFEIDGDSGVIRNSRSLIGLARAQPYELQVTATDGGSPPLATSTVIKLHIIESSSLSTAGDDKKIHIIAPSVGYVLELDENIPANQRVYTVEARIGRFNDQFEREIKYTIEPVGNRTDSGWFSIDSSSGDVFTQQTLDFEAQPAITVSVPVASDSPPRPFAVTVSAEEWRMN